MMVDINRNSQGQFAPKGEKKKPQRIIRISDEDWEVLGYKAANRGLTRTDLIEELCRKN